MASGASFSQSVLDLERFPLSKRETNLLLAARRHQREKRHHNRSSAMTSDKPLINWLSIPPWLAPVLLCNRSPK
jgi:hypothetical protein